nr:MAG TPA: hypothetical protein [Caudoviricetes sp.]
MALLKICLPLIGAAASWPVCLLPQFPSGLTAAS